MCRRSDLKDLVKRPVGPVNKLRLKKNERGSKPWSEESGLLRIQYNCNFRAPQVGLISGRMAILLVMFNNFVYTRTALVGIFFSLSEVAVVEF